MTTTKRAGTKGGATKRAVAKKAAKKAAPARAPASKATAKKARAKAAPKKSGAKKSGAKKVGAKAAKKRAAAKSPATKRASKAVAKKTSAARGREKPVVKAKKVARKAMPKKRAVTAPKAKPAADRDRDQASRWDGAGHLDPAYAAGLRERSREAGEAGGLESDERAFVATTHTEDPLAEELGEDFVAGATSGEGQGEEALDRVEADENGGPFVVTDGTEEFADGTDASNPEDAEREPFPRV